MHSSRGLNCLCANLEELMKPFFLVLISILGCGFGCGDGQNSAPAVAPELDNFVMNLNTKLDNDRAERLEHLSKVGEVQELFDRTRKEFEEARNSKDGAFLFAVCDSPPLSDSGG